MADDAFLRWFQALPWYQQFKQQYGEAPDHNSQDYDYRAAFQRGVTPQPYEHDVRNGQQMYHWPSVAPDGYPLKSINHPTAWMEDYMRITGKDPHTPARSLTPDQLQAFKNALQIRYGRPVTTPDEAMQGQRRLQELFK